MCLECGVNGEPVLSLGTLWEAVRGAEFSGIFPEALFHMLRFLPGWVRGMG